MNKMIVKRIILIALWILSVVGISFYGGPVSYGLFWLLTFIPIICLLYLVYVFFTYRIYQEIETKQLVANHSIPYFITLQNERRILFSGIQVKFYSTFSDIDGVDDEREYELSPGDGIKLETSLVCKYRGEYEVGIKRIILTDFLGIFRFSFRNPEPLRVIVKPQLVHLSKMSHNISENLSSIETGTNSSRPDVLVRDYIPGDSLHKINWRATARTDKLQVRTEIGEEKRGVLLLLDACRYSNEEYDYIPVENRILELSLAVSYYYVNQNIPVTVITQQKDGKLFKMSAESAREFDRLYNAVSEIAFDDRLTQKELAKQQGIIKLMSEYTAAVLVMGAADAGTAMLQDDTDKAGLPMGMYLVCDTSCEKKDSEAEDIIYKNIVRVDCKAPMEESL